MPRTARGNEVAQGQQQRRPPYPADPSTFPANSYPNPNTYQQHDPISFHPELKDRQGYNTVKVMAAPREPMIQPQYHGQHQAKAAGLLQRKSPQRRVLGIGLQRSSHAQKSHASNINDESVESIPDQKFSKKIQDSAVCRSPKIQNMQSESFNDRSDQEKSMDNSLQIIQNNFNKPQVGGSAPNQKQPQRRVFGQARDTIKQYSPSMRVQNNLNNQMQLRADSFKNGGREQDQQQLDESSFVETAERRDKVSMVFGAEESQLMENPGTKNPLKQKNKRGGAKASGLRVRANSNATNVNNAAAHLSNALNDPNESFDYFYKIIIIGDESVGKTNFLLRISQNFYEAQPKRTYGVEYVFRNIALPNSNQTVRAQIWDTSGAKQFLSITTTHYRFAVGAFLVYDVCNVQSFINLRDWLHKIREFSDNDVVIGLVANKCDLVDEDDRKNCYGKYSSRNMQNQEVVPEQPQMLHERRTPRRAQDNRPKVYGHGPPLHQYSDDRLEPDEHEQMGLKQAQAMRRCFSDPEMNQQQHVQPPSASTPGQGQGGKVSKQSQQKPYMQPQNQRNFSPSKGLGPSSKSPRLYGGAYIGDRGAQQSHSPVPPTNAFNNGNFNSMHDYPSQMVARSAPHAKYPATNVQHSYDGNMYNQS